MIKRRSVYCLPFVVLSSLSGCATSMIDLPPIEPSLKYTGPVVHIENETPEKPVALYRLEHETAGTSERGAVRVGTEVGGRGVDSTSVSQEGTVERRLICLAPCDVRLPGWPGQRFFLAGNGVVPSARFSLDPSWEKVNIRARAGSATGRALGSPFIGVGIALLLVGGLMIPFGVTQQDRAVTGTAVGTTVLGAGLLGAGIPLLRSGGSTTVTFD
jgi:hypothetical protein